MIDFSVIVPVYNRPQELLELLESLTLQTYTAFEVIVVDDGSTVRAESICSQFKDRLDIRYYFKTNEGQGFARNYGYQQGKGRYLIVFDSDCLVPKHYLEEVDQFLKKNPVDAYGGPDAAHPSFSTVQKAISQSMTSFFTTGGIRGRKSHIGQYHPRSFNMGISRELFERTKGYILPFMGEDLEFSTRIIKLGYRTALIPRAFVYHKRRTDLRKFFRQLIYFGRARINLTRFHPEQLKLIHLFPTVFLFGLIFFLGVAPVFPLFAGVGLALYVIYLCFVLVESWIVTRTFAVALLTPVAALLQLTGYGYGLVYEWVRKLRGINPNTRYIELY